MLCIVSHTRGWWRFSLADIKKISCRSDLWMHSFLAQDHSRPHTYSRRHGKLQTFSARLLDSRTVHHLLCVICTSKYLVKFQVCNKNKTSEMNSPLLQVVGGGGGINFAVRWEEVLPHFFSSTILNTFPLTFFWQHRIQMRRLSLINALPINFPFRPREKLLIFLNSILQILVLWTTNQSMYLEVLEKFAFFYIPIHCCCQTGYYILRNRR